METRAPTGWRRDSAGCHWPISRPSQSAGPAPSPVTVPASHFTLLGCLRPIARSCRSCHRPVRSPLAPVTWSCSHLGHRSHQPALGDVASFALSSPGLPIIIAQLGQKMTQVNYDVKETFQVKVYYQTMKTARKKGKKVEPKKTTQGQSKPTPELVQV